MSAPLTPFGQTINRLASASDPAERERLAALLTSQIEQAFAQQTNVAQVVRWETEEWLRQRVGEMNDVVSQAAAEQRDLKQALANGFGGLHADVLNFRAAQEAAADQLRREFRETAETVNEIAGDVALLKRAGAEQEKVNRRIETRIGEHASQIGAIEEEMAAFRHSRDASIKERRQLAKQLADLSTQLAAVLAHLPAIDVSEAGG